METDFPKGQEKMRKLFALSLFFYSVLVIADITIVANPGNFD